MLFVLYSSGLAARRWKEVMFAVAICEILDFEAANCISEVNTKEKWDLILCSLSSWMQTVEENRQAVATAVSYDEMSKQALIKVNKNKMCNGNSIIFL